MYQVLPISEKKNQTIELNSPHFSANVDPEKLRHVLNNLISNAIKYTPEEGVVTVSATTDNGKIRINFEDTGIGISEDELPHIFERFYRCDRSRSKGGVGLGLSLTKVYTESMKGTISVNSTVNQGTTFILKFAR